MPNLNSLIDLPSSLTLPTAPMERWVSEGSCSLDQNRDSKRNNSSSKRNPPMKPRRSFVNEDEGTAAACQRVLQEDEHDETEDNDMNHLFSSRRASLRKRIKNDSSMAPTLCSTTYEREKGGG